MVVEGFTRKNKAGLNDSDYEANRSILVRIICDSRNRDDNVYRRTGEIHQGELHFIFLPGIETLTLSPAAEVPKEQQLLSKGISTLYRVVTSLSQGRATPATINWHVSKLLHYLQGALLPTACTAVVSLINPLRSHQRASLASLAFCHRVRKLPQSPKPWKTQNKGVVMAYLKEQWKRSEQRVKELAEELQIKAEALTQLSTQLDAVSEQERAAAKAKAEVEKQVEELRRRLEEQQESSVLLTNEWRRRRGVRHRKDEELKKSEEKLKETDVTIQGMSEELKKKEDKLKETDVTIQGMNEELKRREVLLQENETKLKAIESSLTGKQEECDAFQREMREKEGVWQRQVTTLAASLSVFEDTLRKLKRERDEEKQKASEQGTELEKKRKLLEDMDGKAKEAAELKTELALTQRQLESLQKGLQCIEAKYQTACKEIRIHRDETLKDQDHINKLRLQIEVLEAEKKGIETSIAKERSDRRKSEEAAQAELRAELEAKEKRIGVLTQSEATMKEAMEAAEKEKRSEAELRAQSELKMRMAEEELKRCQQQLTEEKMKGESLSRQVNEMLANATNMDEMIPVLQEKQKELEKLIEAKEEEITATRGAKQTVEAKSMALMQCLTSTREMMKKKEEESERRVSVLEEEVKEKKRSVEVLESKEEGYKKMMAELEEEVKKEKEERMKKEEAMHEEVRRKEKRIVDCEKDVKAKEQSILSLEKQVKELNDTVLDVESDLKKKRETIAEMEERVKEKEKEIGSMGESVKEKEE